MKNIMDEFELINNLPILEKREWSFLDTIGVSHRETIIANLLGYFFDPNEKHELGDTFIKALIQTKPYFLHNHKEEEKIEEDIKFFSDENYTFENADVIIEDTTDNNKRIDIVIKTNELMIAIEFKINHSLNNPLNDYVLRIKNEYKKKYNYFIVLTPKWKKPEGEAINNNDFKQVILSHFIKNVEAIVEKKKLYNNQHIIEKGELIVEKKIDIHQQHIYQDFIITIKNRAKTMKMINKYFEKIKTGDLKIENVENAFKNLNIIKMHFEKKTDQLMKHLNKANGEVYSILSATKDRVESAIVKNIDNKSQLKIRLSLKGWNIEFWRKKYNKFELERSKNISENLSFSDIEIEEKIKELENQWQTKIIK